MTMITVPSTLAEGVRMGAHTALGESAEQVAIVSQHPKRESRVELYCGPLTRLDAARALLDRIGWRLTGARALGVPESERTALLAACSCALETSAASGELALFTAALGEVGSADTEGSE